MHRSIMCFSITLLLLTVSNESWTNEVSPKPEMSSANPLLFPNSDFEEGSLNHWRAIGKAFLTQPTYGDNIAVRERGRLARPQGNWWVGTYENYQALPGQKPGDTQKNEPTGELVSERFIITTPYIGFLISGGSRPTTSVRLIVNGNVVCESTGLNHPLMRREFWDVRKFINQPAIISVIDNDRGSWGCINVDDFRGYKALPDMLLFPNSDFEKGDLTNWKPDGSAFDRQPTLGDNPSAREKGKHSRHQGKYWVGTYELFQGKPDEVPGGKRGDVAFGTLRSIPFKIRGPAIGFLLGGGKGPGLEVRLYVKGKIERTAKNPVNKEDMSPVVWDVSAFRDMDAEIEVVDDSMDAWGHINVDDFRYLRLFNDW